MLCEECKHPFLNHEECKLCSADLKRTVYHCKLVNCACEDYVGNGI